MISKHQRALAILVGLGLLIAYLLQLASPLRLWQDGIDHLVVAESVLDGHGFHRDWGSEPPGYPAMVVLLSALGLAHPAGFIALNLASLALALISAFLICRNAFGFGRWTSTLIVMLTPLSWVVVKHSTLAAGDIPYFGVSMAALAALGAVQRRGSALLWLAAASLTTAAILIRTIGIALLPAVLWVAWHARTSGMPTLQKPVRPGGRLKNWLGLGCVFVVVGVVIVSVLKTVYASQIPSVYSRGVLEVVLEGIVANLKELGEIVTNVPASKTPGLLRPTYLGLGLIPVAGLVYGLWLRRASLGAVDLYLGGYLFIRCVWPYHDARFWVPVLPLAMGWTVTSVKSLGHRWPIRRLIQGYVVAFAFLGVLALAYSTRISFSGSTFPALYGDGTLRPAYEAAFGHAAPPDLSVKNRVALRLLRRFGYPTSTQGRRPRFPLSEPQ